MHALSDPLVISAGISTGGFVLRAALQELRWWLALHGTSPADRPAIIRALQVGARRPSLTRR